MTQGQKEPSDTVVDSRLESNRGNRTCTEMNALRAIDTSCVPQRFNPCTPNLFLCFLHLSKWHYLLSQYLAAQATFFDPLFSFLFLHGSTFESQCGPLDFPAATLSWLPLSLCGNSFFSASTLAPTIHSPLSRVHFKKSKLDVISLLKARDSICEALRSGLCLRLPSHFQPLFLFLSQLLSQASPGSSALGMDDNFLPFRSQIK